MSSPHDSAGFRSSPSVPPPPGSPSALNSRDRHSFDQSRRALFGAGGERSISVHFFQRLRATNLAHLAATLDHYVCCAAWFVPPRHCASLRGGKERSRQCGGDPSLPCSASGPPRTCCLSDSRSEHPRRPACRWAPACHSPGERPPRPVSHRRRGRHGQRCAPQTTYRRPCEPLGPRPEPPPSLLPPIFRENHRLRHDYAPAPGAARRAHLPGQLLPRPHPRGAQERQGL